MDRLDLDIAHARVDPEFAQSVQRLIGENREALQMLAENDHADTESPEELDD